MYCYNCGQFINSSDEYCSKCGANQRVNLLEDSQNRAIPGKTASMIFNEMSTAQKTWSIVGIVVAILVALASLSGGNSSFNLLGNGALNEPAVNYIIPGEASQTLQQIWGVELNSSSGPITLKEMADQAFYYTSRSVGGNITKSEVEIAFQPGNSMYTFFNRLLNSNDAIDAVKSRWVSLAD